MPRARAVRFVLVGLVAVAVSAAVQQLSLRAGAGIRLTTLARLLVTLPLLHLGYSRFVLGDELADSRRRSGWLRAELRMAGRTGASIGASVGLKLVLEPPITAALVGAGGASLGLVSVALADFLYGPLINYWVLTRLTRVTRSAARGSATLAPRRTSLDALALPRPVRAVLRAVFAVLARARLYRTGRRSTGNIETMTLGDKLHWLYKSEHPLREGLAAGAFPRESVLRIDGVGGVGGADGVDGVGGAEPLCLIGTGDAFACSTGADDLGGLLEALRPELDGADLRFFNLEAPIGASGTSLQLSARETPRLVMARAELDALLDGFGEGTTVVSVANNHTLDGGADGIEATIAALRERSVAAIGVCGRAASYAPTLVSAKGATVGFVAATFGVNGQPAPEGTGPLVRIAPLNEDAGDAALAELLGDVAWCRERACDVVVASLHWGLEHEFVPRDSQRRLARRLVEAGVDVVLGHHPHVIQPWELVRSADGRRAGVVFYSMGNFTNPLNDPTAALGLMAKIELARAGATWRVAAAEAIPILQLRSAAGDRTRMHCHRLSRLLAAPATTGDVRAFADEAAAIADSVVGTDWRGQGTG